MEPSRRSSRSSPRLPVGSLSRGPLAHLPSQLDSLAIYHPEDQRELQSICERVTPRLQHVNAAVVLSAVKVILKLLEGITDLDYKAQLLTKLAPPLVTLLSSEPEVQYVALRNINLIAQKYQSSLTAHMKVFFVNQ